MLPIDLEERLSQFETDWEPEQFVELARFLEDVDPGYRLELVAELVMTDLELSVRGESSRDDLRQRLANHLDQFPELREHRQLLAKVETHYKRLYDKLPATVTASELTAAASTTVDLPGGIHPGFELPYRFGKYELLSVLGRGGMGVVYEAQQIRPTRRVAIKIVHPFFDSELEAAERFTREIELASQMDDTRVVSIYESGVQDGLSYYVMPICMGGTLRSKVQEGPLSPREAASLISEVARTLAIAHSRNVVHRDIQPGNILFDRNGRTLIADFGLSKHLAHDQNLTVEGQIFGCPGYVPPERVLNLSSTHDERLEDLFSLGALLYFVLCGRPPYMGRNRIETFTKAMAKPPVPIGQQNPDVDRDLETICMKAMAVRPENRYASCSDFADDLDRYLKGESIRARRPSWVQRSRIFAKQNPMLTTWFVIVPCILVMTLGLFGLYREATFQKSRSDHQAEMNDVAEYHRLLAEADSRVHEQKQGWIDASTRLLERAIQLGKVNTNKNVMREKIAITALRRDVRRLGVVAKDYWADALAFDSQGKWLAVGQNKDLGGFHLWLYSVESLRQPLADSKPVKEVWVDSTIDDAIRLGDGHSKPNDGARSIAFSPDGKRFAVGTRHGRVHVYDWDGVEATLVETFNPGPDIEVFQLQFSRFDDSLWARLDNKSLFVIQQGEVSPFLESPVEHAGKQMDHLEIREFALSATEPVIYFIRDEHTLYRMNLVTGQIEWAYEPLGEQEELKGVAVTPDGRGLMVKLEQAQVFDFVDSKLGKRCYSTLVPQLPRGDSPIRQEFFDDGSLMLTTAYERTIRVWDVSNGQVVTEIYVPERQGCPRIAGTEKQPVFAVAGHEKVTVYEVVGSDVLQSGPSAKLPLLDFAIDQDQNSIATIGWQDGRSHLGRLQGHAVHDIAEGQIQFEHLRAETDYRPEGNQAFVTWLGQNERFFTAGRKGASFAVPLLDENGVAVSLKPLAAAESIQVVESGWACEVDGCEKETQLRIQPKLSSQNTLSIKAEVDSRLGREISGWHDCYVGARIDGAELTGLRYQGATEVSIRRPTVLQKDGMAYFWMGRHRLRKGELFQLSLQLSDTPTNVEIDGIWFDQGPFTADKLPGKSNDEGVVASVFHPETRRLWEVFNSRKIRTWTRVEEGDEAAYEPQETTLSQGSEFDVIATSGPFVFMGGREGALATFDSQSARLVHQSVPHRSRVRAITGVGAQGGLAVAYENGMLSILGAKKHEVRQNLQLDAKGVNSLCFDPTRERLFAGTSSGDITILAKVDVAGNGGIFVQHETLRPGRGAIRKIEVLPERGLLVVLFEGSNSIHYLDLNKLEKTYDMFLAGISNPVDE